MREEIVVRGIVNRGLRIEGVESWNRIKETCKWPRKIKLLRRRKVSLCCKSGVITVCFCHQSTAA